MSINWVMLARDGEIVKLPGEKIYYKVRSRIALDLSAEPSPTGAAPDFALKSDSGVLYLTNLRVVYLPAHPTAALRSFSAPILDVDDTRVASRFFGPWSWTGLVRPTPGGGVPAAVARLACRLTFRDGGHDAFQSAFEARKERLAYARALEAETGQVIPTEDLPRYEGPAVGAGAGAGAAATGTGTGIGVTTTGATTTTTGSEPTTTTTDTDTPTPSDKEREALGAFAAAHEQALAAAQAQSEPRNEAAEADAQADGWTTAGAGPGADEDGEDGHAPPPAHLTPTPDEPPPDYEAAQAQAVGIRLEARLREAAER